MSLEAAARQLRDDLARCPVPLSEADAQSIRSLLHRYVDELKHLGSPPERVLVQVKQIVHDAGSTAPHWRVDSKHREAVIEQFVKWSIERYYWTPPAGQSEA